MKFKEFRDKIEGLSKLSEGWRGVIYTGFWNGERVSVKVAKDEKVVKAIQKEADILERLKGMEEFPQILFKGEDFFLYRFIDGIPFRRAGLNPEEKKRVYRKLLEIAYKLDSMGIVRDEFSRIDKNVLIGKEGKVYLLDFERGKLSSRPSNLTQFLQLLVREGFLSRDFAVELGKRYLRDREGVYREVLGKLE